MIFRNYTDCVIVLMSFDEAEQHKKLIDHYYKLNKAKIFTLTDEEFAEIHPYLHSQGVVVSEKLSYGIIVEDIEEFTFNKIKFSS